MFQNDTTHECCEKYKNTNRKLTFWLTSYGLARSTDHSIHPHAQNGSTGLHNRAQDLILRQTWYEDYPGIWASPALNMVHSVVLRHSQDCSEKQTKLACCLDFSDLGHRTSSIRCGPWCCATTHYFHRRGCHMDRIHAKHYVRDIFQAST